jgi:hypothetical protein
MLDFNSETLILGYGIFLIFRNNSKWILGILPWCQGGGPGSPKVEDLTNTHQCTMKDGW